MADNFSAKDLGKFLRVVDSLSGGQAEIEPVDEDDIFKLKVTLRPNNGVFKDGEFIFEVDLPNYFPNEPANTITCKTPMYHPNISGGLWDWVGSTDFEWDQDVCINILDSDDWTSNMGLEEIVNGLLFLLCDDEGPNFDDALNSDVYPDHYDQAARVVVEGGWINIECSGPVIPKDAGRKFKNEQGGTFLWYPGCKVGEVPKTEPEMTADEQLLYEKEIEEKKLKKEEGEREAQKQKEQEEKEKQKENEKEQKHETSSSTTSENPVQPPPEERKAATTTKVRDPLELSRSNSEPTTRHGGVEELGRYKSYDPAAMRKSTCEISRVIERGDGKRWVKYKPRTASEPNTPC